MTPKPESETDPWKAIQRYEFVQTNFAYTTDHEMARDAEGEWARWEAVDAARAAEAAQHQQEIAAKDKQLEQERLVNNRLRLSWREDVDEERAKLNHTRARLAAVEAERDAKSRLIAELEGEAKDLKYHPISGIYAIEAERDRLKAALSTAAFALDLAGFRRDRDAAYAALTPQGQSTDGETR